MSLSNRGGAIYVNNGNVSSNDNLFQYCYLTTSGGIFTLDNLTILNENQSVYESNAALQGGAITAINSTFSLTGASFFNNYAYLGGVLYLTGANTFTI